MGEEVKNGHFCFSPDELGAPDASHPFTLFDWQGQNDLKSILSRFGGVENIAKSLGTDLKKGLMSSQVADVERVSKYGSNKPEEKKGVTYWELIWEGLHDFTLLVLITAAIVSIITGIISEGPETGWIDGVAILVAVVLILNVSAINDLQKDRQFRTLNAINNRKKIKVVRDGETSEIIVDDIVCGDLLFITGGDTIPADLLYITGTNVKMDESKLTGEPDQLKKNETKPFIVSSSECHDGSLYGLVVAVGPYSVFGKMKTMIEGGNDESTPLQMKLEHLTTQISVAGAAVGVLVIFAMLIRHLIEVFTQRSWIKSDWNALVHFFITGVAILVVAIPEGLPLAVTIALAYSVKRMMVDNNLVRHLAACETMGGANTICSDKTGTLTMGQMTVMQGWVYKENSEDDSVFLNKFQQLSGEERKEFIDNMKGINEELKQNIVDNSCLNNDAFLIKEEGKPERGNGSSLDIALIKFTRELGPTYEYSSVRAKYPKDLEPGQPGIVKSYPFHSNRKRAGVVVRLPDGKFRIYVKGAPEMLIRLCDNVVSENGVIKKMNGNFTGDSAETLSGNGSRFKVVKHCILPMAATGLRVIGLAYRDLDSAQDWEETVEYSTDEAKGVGPCPKLESGLTLAGLIGVQDPPRPEVPQSVKDCQKAGIFVRMVTGDNIETAKAIAKQVNIYHKDGYTDGQGRRWPPGKSITGPEFREKVGGLVLPPHFDHQCHCTDLSSDSAFKEGFMTPKYPYHFGYPSIVGHISDECKHWKTNNPGCNDECKQRGCFKQMKKVGDKSEEQKYYTIKNQYVFEQYVNTLQVMARSAPTDKHMLVTGLMERRLVVAVTGDGTNDGPALSKSNVGFAMGIAGTSIAKDASDIILMDDNFTSIVKAVLWGRNVYDSIRKFLQFQLTVNAVACTLAFVSALIIKESPLKPVQMLWVNLIMDTFASLALATEYPTNDLLDRPPYHRDESLLSKCMFRNLLGHFFFQIIIVMVFTFAGHEIIGEPTGLHLSTEAPATRHFTMIFNVFVMMQVFNEINSRKINNEVNVFSRIHKNALFLIIVIGTFLVQILIVSVGGRALGCETLSVLHHVVALIIGAFSLVVYQLFRFVPYNWFIDLGNTESEGKSGVEFLQRARSRLHSSSLPAVAGDMPQPGRQKMKLFD